MRERRPSSTSAMVATLRALGDAGITTVPGFHDPTARVLLPWTWSIVYEGTRWLWGHTPAARRALFTRIVDALPLRVCAIEAELRRALAAGCRQVVLLGAGLDGRAHRMAELVDVAVFEVDHPATQAYKRRRAAELPRRSAALVYVPVDFERDDLGTRLAAAGHRADLPTAWIWEGVTMYLTDGAFEGTLRAIAGRSAPASVVLVHYLPPPEPHEARDAEVRTMRTIVRVWSEPLIGMRPPEAVARAVADAGLELVGDTGAEEWARTFGSDPVMVFGGRSRLAVARAIRPSRTLR